MMNTEYKIVKRDDDVAKKAEKGLKDNYGYCPCKLKHEPKNKCMCRSFNLMVQNSLWFGTCECGLYEKVSVEK